VLRDLAVVNRWTFAVRPTLSFLSRAVGKHRRVRVLDVGYGYGDILRIIGRWANDRGVSAELVGIDRDPRSAPVAAAATPAEMNIEFLTGDYQDLQGPFDIILSSLVAHHMDESEIAHFLDFMERRASAGWLINDLHRHRLALILFPILASALRVDPIVLNDGKLSIARSFRKHEWKTMLEAAGLGHGEAQILRYFPFRLCVERRF
jgi:2-polyprenyl-3-methyl-5-hydroxy-6-metoxy-1,4-benzoquinol methylase